MRSRERAAAVALAGVLAWAVAACGPATRRDLTPSLATDDGHSGDDTHAALRAVLEATAESLPAGWLRVRLAFPAGADLDLFVTDPAYETVYFANSQSRSGGRLERDVRCDDPAPRVETVVFPGAAPGRYRVGVDFPRPCREGDTAPAAFLVAVYGAGASQLHPGRIPPGVFLPIVLEIERRESEEN